MNLQTKNPIRKVTFASIAGSIVVLGIWLVKTIFHFEIPGEVGAAITAIIGFITSYFTKSAPEDLIPTEVPPEEGEDNAAGPE
jgi:hypothetical protein